jgi:hypothetical protein
MSTSAAQIAANQKNAQLSTGPTTATGLAISAKNATRHGFTGHTLVLTPQEQEAYDAHVAAFMASHNPVNHKHRELVQQYADAQWSLHQIFVQQANTIALMNAITRQLSEAGDPLATAAAVAPVSRTLNTLSIYETRRRRAAKQIQQELNEMEQQIRDQREAEARKANKTKPQPQNGSVCSSTPVPAGYEALRLELEAEFTPEEAAELLRDSGYRDAGYPEKTR